MTDERYAPPRAESLAADPLPGDPVHYVGFWARVGASLIDTVLAMVVIVPLSLVLVGDMAGWAEGGGLMSITLNYLLPAVIVIAFWIVRGATPGKMAISAVIVDARTLGAPSRAQWVIRYIGYYVSAIPLCLGLIWVGFDARKQGWHDKMAGTVVVRRLR